MDGVKSVSVDLDRSLVTVTYDDATTAVANLTATLAARAYQVVAIREILSNRDPTADAGVGREAAPGDEVVLDGTGSSDPDGDTLVYAWTQVSGPEVALSDPLTPRPHFAAPEVPAEGAALEFELRVGDPAGREAFDRVVVRIALPPAPAHADLTPPTASALLESLPGLVVLDVREPDEFCGGHIPGALNVPWRSGVLAARLGEYPPEGAYLVVCKGGVRSDAAASYLDDNGFREVYDLLGGMDAWPGPTTACVPEPAHRDVGAAEAAGLLERDTGVVVLDVREPEEFCAGHIAGARNLPWRSGVLQASLGELSPEGAYLVVCQGGVRSDAAASFLDGQGFLKVYDLLGGMGSWEGEVVACEAPPAPPVAVAGADRAVVEGERLLLDGSASHDPGSEPLWYRWAQTGGPPVLPGVFEGPILTLVAPPTSPAGETLAFTLTVGNARGLEGAAQVQVSVADCGVGAFPDNVLPLAAATGRNAGLRVEAGGFLAALAALGPDAYPESPGGTWDLPYGLVDLEVRVTAPGAGATLVVYFAEPATPDHLWHQWGPGGACADMGDRAVFAERRDRVTLTLEDGGAGDVDGEADGVLRVRAALGRLVPDGEPPAEAEVGGGGGGGCFLRALSPHLPRPRP